MRPACIVDKVKVYVHDVANNKPLVNSLLHEYFEHRLPYYEGRLMLSVSEI